jgi:hypothetical protein
MRMSGVMIGLGLGVAGLVAPAGEPLWQPLAASGDGAVDLRMALVPDETGQQQVMLRNFGRLPLHFAYRIAGAQSAKEAEANPRMHLSVKGRALLLASPKATGVLLSEVRAGENDEGPFLKF